MLAHTDGGLSGHLLTPQALVGLRRPSRDFSRCAYGGYGGAWSHRPLPVERFHEAAPVQRVMTAPRKLWPQEYDKVK